MLEIKRFQKIDMLLCIIFIMALGFRTNYFSFEKNLSTIIMLIFFLCIVISQQGVVRIGKSRQYVLWYTAFVAVCILSMLWAKYNTTNYVYALVKDVYVPISIILFSMDIYLNKTQNPLRLLNTLVFAENIVILRVVVHTPWVKVLSSYDSRLLGNGLRMNYNDYTTQMALVSMVVAYIAFYADKRYRKILWLYIMLIIISGSRKAIAVSALGFFLIYIFSAKRDFKKIIKRVITLIFLFILLLVVIFNNNYLYNSVGIKIVDMIHSFGMDSGEMLTAYSSGIDHSLHGRAVLREQAWKQFLNNPVKGLGYYCFRYTNSYHLYAHNNYLELLADLGIIGFGIYYLIYLKVMLKAMKYRAISRNMNQSNGFFVFSIIFLMILLVMEYAQITFYRLFALVPFMAVVMCMEGMIGEIWRNK